MMSLGLLLVGLLSLQIHRQGEKDETRAVDVIVVLGAAQWDGQPSPVLQARLDHAVLLYNIHASPTVIVTGGVGERETLSEAEVSKAYLIMRGIPEAAILMEREGCTSLQSIRAAKQIMDERRMRSCLLVSDPFHMMRILKMARDAGMEAYGSPTRTSPISKNRHEESKQVRREIFLYVMYLTSRVWEGMVPDFRTIDLKPPYAIPQKPLSHLTLAAAHKPRRPENVRVLSVDSCSYLKYWTVHKGYPVRAAIVTFAILPFKH